MAPVSEGQDPRRIDLRGRPATEVAVEELADHVRGGGVLVHPTETVYGFGSRTHGEGLERLRALKGLSADRPVLLLVPDRRSVEGLAWNGPARRLARAFWPGAVTLLLSDPDRTFPEGVRSDAGAVGVRRTAHPLTARLVEALREPLTSTSANPPGGTPARDGKTALDVARALGGGPRTWVLDVGALPPSAASTIVDCTGAVPRIVRAGATPVERLRRLIPEIDDFRGT